ncbi:MAG: UNC-like C-terminal-domain-containing protein [Benjaminiella poitrasii]|nr:MAG: UNC-like C-terminal-domain-containing protein [Benjaminiella poitrasii]
MDSTPKRKPKEPSSSSQKHSSNSSQKSNVFTSDKSVPHDNTKHFFHETPDHMSSANDHSDDTIERALYLILKPLVVITYIFLQMIKLLMIYTIEITLQLLSGPGLRLWREFLLIIYKIYNLVYNISNTKSYKNESNLSTDAEKNTKEPNYSDQLMETHGDKQRDHNVEKLSNQSPNAEKNHNVPEANREVLSELRKLIVDKLVEECLQDAQHPLSYTSAFHQFKKLIPDKITVKTDANGKLLPFMDNFHIILEDPSIWESFWTTYMYNIKTDEEINGCRITERFITVSKKMLESKLELDVMKLLFEKDQKQTSIADFALESRGGRILYSKSSPMSVPTVSWKFHLRRFLGVPVAYHPPKYAIQPGLHVGECWSMAGRSGTLGILLSEPILVHSVTIEYPSSYMLMNEMNRAPRRMEILGLPGFPNTTEHGSISLGKFTFDIHKQKNKYRDNVQTFELDFYPEIPIRAIVVKIKSNWGNKHQTDIYGIRIHGMPGSYIE